MHAGCACERLFEAKSRFQGNFPVLSRAAAMRAGRFA
jgi:hypothetical protein